MDKRESNILKGTAIIFMLIHHLFNDKKLIKLAEFGSSSEKTAVYHMAIFFKICVPIFVFISAYGLSKQYMKKGILKDSRTIAKDAFRRYRKLLYGLWTIMAVVVVVAHIVNRYLPEEVYARNDANAIKNFVFDMLGLSEFFGTAHYNNTWWYISFAVLLFMILPLINMLHEKVGSLIIPLSLFAAVLLQEFQGTLANYLERYIIGVAAAVTFAREDTIERYKKIISPWYLRLTAFIFFGAAFAFCYYLRSKLILDYYVIDNLTAIVLIMLVCTISGIKVLSPLYAVLYVLGLYSMNMFLGHTFIKSYFFKDFTYSFKKWWLIALILILISFAVSFAVEMLKKGIQIIINKIKKSIKEKGGSDGDDMSEQEMA